MLITVTSLSTDIAGNILFHTRHHRERSRGADFGENAHPLLTSAVFSVSHLQVSSWSPETIKEEEGFPLYSL